MIKDFITREILQKELNRFGTDEFSKLHDVPFLQLKTRPLVQESCDYVEFTTSRIEASTWGSTVHANKDIFVEVRKSDRNEYGNKITVGRTLNNDIVILDGRISKVHAFFMLPVEHDINDYRLVDIGSSNGTRLEGRRLEEKIPTVIKFGQTLCFWKYEFLFLHSRDMIELLR